MPYILMRINFECPSVSYRQQGFIKTYEVTSRYAQSRPHTVLQQACNHDYACYRCPRVADTVNKPWRISRITVRHFTKPKFKQNWEHIALLSVQKGANS